jgi:hypothetical protein
MVHEELKLRTRDGREISVALDKLSEADQEWIRQRRKAR